MKFTVSQKEFLKKAKIAKRFAAKKSTFPPLEHILIQADESGSVTLSSTDLETAVVVKLNIKQFDAPGSIAILAKELVDRIGKFNTGEMITLEAGSLQMSINGLVTNGLEAKEFPAINTTSNLIQEVSSSNFLKLVRVANCAEKKLSRPTLHTVFMEFGDECAMVASDGYRLARQCIAALACEKKSAIVSLDCVSNLITILDKKNPVSISLGNQLIVLKNGDVTVVSNLVDGKYPDYKAIIPTQQPLSAILNKKSLTDTLKLLSVSAEKAENMVFFSAHKCENSQFVAQMHARGDDKNIKTIDMVWPASQPEYTIAFNCDFMLDILDQIDTVNTSIDFNRATDPMLITPIGEDHFQGVLMPMHVKNNEGKEI